MNVALISIGDELLNGQTINTNATWLGEKLSELGVSVKIGLTIKDCKEEIESALDFVFDNVDLVILTGGLGPTKDDITKKVLAEYFKTELLLNQEVLENVKSYFKKWNKELLEVNIQQAYLPKDARILPNKRGTASGKWYEKEGAIVISLPGVPHEMKGIMEEYGFPLLQERIKEQKQISRTLNFQGIGETYIAERINDLLLSLEQKKVKYAFLPAPGLVRLRFDTQNESILKELERTINIIKERLDAYFFGEGKISLEKVVFDLLQENHKTVSTIESCTSGAIATALTKIPGVSNYFKGTIIAYSNEIKEKQVGVRKELLIKKGAVSEEVVDAMAKKGREIFNTDYCIATTGILGPGDSDGVKEGTVWISIASKDNIIKKCFHFGSGRNRNREIAVLTALNLLRKVLS